MAKAELQATEKMVEDRMGSKQSPTLKHPLGYWLEGARRSPYQGAVGFEGLDAKDEVAAWHSWHY